MLYNQDLHKNSFYLSILMKMKNVIDRIKRYEYSKYFFDRDGNCIMKFSASAAIDICRECIKKSIYIWRIEGGIWHNPGFEARVDCIWDSSYHPNLKVNINVEENNTLAEEFIREESDIHDTFIITIYQKNTSG